MTELDQRVVEALTAAIDDAQRVLFATGGRIFLGGFSEALAAELAPRVAAAIEAAVRKYDSHIYVGLPDPDGAAEKAALAALRGNQPDEPIHGLGYFTGDLTP